MSSNRQRNGKGVVTSSQQRAQTRDIDYQSFGKLGKRARQENGLVELTKKFIQLLREAPEQCIDLNEAVGELNVQKRRIYDITNVLEGIGLIVKYRKNKIKWNGQEAKNTKKASHQANSSNGKIAVRGESAGNEMLEEYQALQESLAELDRHEAQLDKHLDHLESHKNDLKKDPAYGRFAYVTYEDLEYLNSSRLLKASQSESDNDSHRSEEDQEEMSKEMILAIRAPYGSTLEIPCEQ